MKSDKIKLLVREAQKARKHAYCPYSEHPVGASVLTKSGKIFSGCNVENAVNNLSLCAEPVAIFKAISHGDNQFEAICVVGKDASPCGACRQVISEFAPPETPIYLVEADQPSSKAPVLTSLGDLLPRAYSPFTAGLLFKKRNRTAVALRRRS